MISVLLIGNVGDGSARFSTENHLARSLVSLGHRVHPVKEAPRCEEEARLVLSRGVDLVLYVRTHGNGWPNAAALAFWDECRAAGTVVASYHLDLYRGIQRRDAMVDKGYALMATDFFFSADGGFECEGVNHVWLPPAIVADEVGVGVPRAGFAGDVAWVGSGSGYHREHPRRQELVTTLVKRYGVRLTRAGDGVTVREWHLNDLYASVKVSAGDSLALDREASLYWSDRVPDAPGRGSVLVHPPMDAARDQLGDAVVWCEDWSVDSQIDKIEEVLAWPDAKRYAHIERAVDIIRQGHTYAHRCQTVLDTIGL